MRYVHETTTSASIVELYRLGKFSQFSELDSMEKSNAFVEAIVSGNPILVVTTMEQNPETREWTFSNVKELAGLIHYFTTEKVDGKHWSHPFPVVKIW